MTTLTMTEKCAGIISRALEVPDEAIYGLADKTYSLLEPLLTPFEQYVNETIPQESKCVYDFVDFLEFHLPPKDLPFHNPSHVLFAILCFFAGLAVFFVLGRILGKRKYRLLKTCHNALLFSLSVYTCIGLMSGLTESRYPLYNAAPSTARGANWRVSKMLYIALLVRFYTFFDAFLMILAQSYRRISSLHVYNHVSIIILDYLRLMAVPNGETARLALLDCLVHVIMYGYYTITALWPDPKHPVRRFSSKNKFWITRGQLIQFCIIFRHCVICAFDLLPSAPTEEFIPYRQEKTKLLAMMNLFYMTSTIILIL